MADFGNILRRGRKLFKMKNDGGVWDRCEECDKRALCYDYHDAKDEVWSLCEECTKLFIKDEE